MTRIYANIIAAVARDNTIGVYSSESGGRIPWARPVDLAWFRRWTLGQCVIMGRNTYESLPENGLPGRQIIVVSKTMLAPTVRVARSLDSALEGAREAGLGAWISGGRELYAEALRRRLVQRMFITRVADTPKLGHKERRVLFPRVEWEEWDLSAEDTPSADTSLRMQIWSRRPGNASVSTI